MINDKITELLQEQHDKSEQALLNESQKLKAQLEQIMESLISFTKRSTYLWSPGGSYSSDDFRNEGAIINSQHLLNMYFLASTKIEDTK